MKGRPAPLPKAALVRGAHAPSRVLPGALAGQRVSNARRVQTPQTVCRAQRDSARAPNPAREGACAPRAVRAPRSTASFQHGWALGVFLLALVLSGQAEPADPIGWRGDGSGRYPSATPPLEWSETKNVLWKTAIGPNRYSSPIVVGDRVFVTADPARLVCVNAGDGRILWDKSNDFAELPSPPPTEEAKPAAAGQSTPTPASDGRFVYAAFGTGIVACYDLQGARQWIRHFPQKPANEYGRATSPVLAGGRLLITLGHLLALDPATGSDVWRNKASVESYGTPVAAITSGVEVLAMPSGQIVRVSDGKILASWFGGLKFASPTVHDDTVYFIQAGASALRFNTASPDEWKEKQVWDQELEGTYYASAVYDQGLIYAVANELIFSIVDAKDGKILTTKELTFPEPANPDADGTSMYPSLSLAGGRIYVFNDQGDALVLEPGRDYKELKRNHLGIGHGSTPAFAGSRIYLRSGKSLYCIGEK
jgi:outer membrane protein assembly factor BamB